MLWIGIHIKNFSIPADADTGKSLVKLDNSRRMENLKKALSAWTLT